MLADAQKRVPTECLGLLVGTPKMASANLNIHCGGLLDPTFLLNVSAIPIA